MKKLTKKYSVQLAGLLLLLTLLPVSCIKDDYAAKEKATVQVTFTTRTLSDETIAGDDLAANERMQTLRVIVAKGGKILYNEYYTENDFALYANGQKYKTVTFSELVTEDEEDRTFDFYAIANEISTGYNDWENVSVQTLENREITHPFSSNSLIPQTAKKTITVQIPQDGGGIQEEKMQLEFVVAKVSLSFSNQTGEEQTLSDVKIVEAKPDKGFLFNDEDNETIYIPDDLNYSDVIWPRYVIPAGTELEPRVYDYPPVYLFPGQNPSLDSGYKLTATLNDSDSRELEMPSITGLKRGQELKINIRLYKEAVDTQIKLTWEVVDWQPSNNIVPPFN